MMATSPAATASRVGLTSRSFSPRPICRPRSPALLRPLSRSGQDEYPTPAQNLPGLRLCNFLFARGCCGIRQALVPANHFRRCATLRIADCGNPGGAREFSFPSRRPAALLEVDGGGLVSD